MKLSRIASALAMATAMASAHALPALDTSDPANMPVFGFGFGGPGLTSYELSFSQASTLTGSLFGLSPSTVMTAITLTPDMGPAISYAAPDSGMFTFGGLSAGAYTLSFAYSSTGFGGFSGTINTTPVPEPETYGLALAGLGVVGFLAARRRKAA
jgi:PEP-CTERM motif